jgi:hypothetical protein
MVLLNIRTAFAAAEAGSNAMANTTVRVSCPALYMVPLSASVPEMWRWPSGTPSGYPLQR